MLPHSGTLTDAELSARIENPTSADLLLLMELQRRRTCPSSPPSWCSEALRPFGQAPAEHHGLLIAELEKVTRGETSAATCCRHWWHASAATDCGGGFAATITASGYGHWRATTGRRRRRSTRGSSMRWCAGHCLWTFSRLEAQHRLISPNRRRSKEARLLTNGSGGMGCSPAPPPAGSSDRSRGSRPRPADRPFPPPPLGRAASPRLPHPLRSDAAATLPNAEITALKLYFVYLR